MSLRVAAGIGMQVLLFSGIAPGIALLSAQARAAVDFVREVQPVLTSKCLGCHSGASAQAGLKLHTRADLLQGGASGAAIVPGSGADSLLVRKVSGRQGMRMPPAGAPLDPETIAIIRQWIDEGAKYDGTVGLVDRVAPLQPRDPPLPQGTATHPIDRFVEAYLRERNLPMPTPVPDALFARRVWMDVIGLPPTPEQLEAFVRDPASGKREALVSRLLRDDTAYAEHWMSFWNDLLRNDEGVIYHGERKSITAWLYASLKQNKRYNVMVDELLNPVGGRGAEGYLIGVTWRGVVSASQTPPMQASQNAAQVFMGMNLKCAACHDSFVNRWKLADTFGLAAMFAEEPLELTRCDVKLGKTAEARFPFEGLDVGFADSIESRRAAAAKWFTHPRNGRFARTIVNRYWRLLFGRGLVEPIDDMDAEPWNQDLLDWLASDFVAHQYDLRHLLKNILDSRAYQMPAVVEAASAKAYVFRGPLPRRISAEQMQDAISLVSGAWQVNSPRTDSVARYTREWRRKSDPLTRALGRPIRDQVYTERSGVPSMLQALELTNGPLLSQRVQKAAAQLLGLAKPAPLNGFDSKMVRSGPVNVEADINGAKEIWLLLEDVDSYDPTRVLAGWANLELVGPDGSVPLAPATGKLEQKEGDTPVIAAAIPSRLRFPIPAGTYSKLRGRALIDERSRQSDISPALRFFVFTEEPDDDRLMRLEGEPPAALPSPLSNSEALTDYLYLHMLARKPTATEKTLAMEILGGATPQPAGVEDLFWALLVSPEFQFLN
ncbi:MAG: PSD1 and planctomycete cytochrome C domain-containing protein [Bryobacterales bacterium]|nr:PSD1 and planctomycete cytochrome C domain-containing protein [Bryobacterales bacterium]